MTRTASVSQAHHGRTVALNRIKRAGFARRLIIAPNDSREPKVRQISVISPSAQGEKCNSSKSPLASITYRSAEGAGREGAKARPAIPATQDNIRADFDAKMAMPTVYSSAWRNAAALAHGHSGSAAKVSAPRISR